MGHFYPQNLDEIALNRIHSKGSASINDLVEIAEKRNQTVHAAEGEYGEKYMLQMGFESLISVHLENGELEPILNGRKEKHAFRVWKTGEIWDEEYVDDDGNNIGNLAILDKIQFRFVKGKKSHYREFIISYIES